MDDFDRYGAIWEGNDCHNRKWGKASFWDASWLQGLAPKDIAPLIFDLSKKRKCSVKKALENDFWVSQINMQTGLSVEHIVQFSKLWEMLQNVHLENDNIDKIMWKPSNDGCYSAKTAYNMQFENLAISPLSTIVWKPWAPPKCNFFAWLILKNRVWMVDRLQKTGWLNSELCKLCNQVQESADNLFFKCQFTIGVWSSLKAWLDLHDVEPRQWQVMSTVKEWWLKGVHRRGQSRREMASFAMLVS
jgi:hypothetical protein